MLELNYYSRICMMTFFLFVVVVNLGVIRCNNDFNNSLENKIISKTTALTSLATPEAVTVTHHRRHHTRRQHNHHHHHKHHRNRRQHYHQAISNIQNSNKNYHWPNSYYNYEQVSQHQQQHRTQAHSHQRRSTTRSPPETVTVKVGQRATLPCFVTNSGNSDSSGEGSSSKSSGKENSSYKVIWSKSGDILALGATKINSDPRLSIQHRYVSEWHLLIDQVAPDDEGDYVCKTNGAFYKVIALRVLMPPSIDDERSTPAGSITVRNGSRATLRCYAQAKPDAVVKWYRWSDYPHSGGSRRSSSSNGSLKHNRHHNQHHHRRHKKEEVPVLNGGNGNEIEIDGTELIANQGGPNVYECTARNSVPPATSRLFNVEPHFEPRVDTLGVRKTFQFRKRSFMLECAVRANPLTKAYWYKSGVTFAPAPEHSLSSRGYSDSAAGLARLTDASSLDDRFLWSLTLTVNGGDERRNSEETFGEYQCCAENEYGLVCSNILVEEIAEVSRQENADQHLQQQQQQQQQQQHQQQYQKTSASSSSRSNNYLIPQYTDAVWPQEEEVKEEEKLPLQQLRTTIIDNVVHLVGGGINRKKNDDNEKGDEDYLLDNEDDGDGENSLDDDDDDDTKGEKRRRHYLTKKFMHADSRLMSSSSSHQMVNKYFKSTSFGLALAFVLHYFFVVKTN